MQISSLKAVVSLAVGLATFVPSLATPIVKEARTKQPVSLPLPSKIITEFPVGTWIENVAVRANGDLILSQLSPVAAVYTVIDPAGPNPKLSLVHTFSGVSALLGIDETVPDVFVVAGANFSGTLDQPTGTAKVWSIDFNKHTPEVKEFPDFSKAALPNGLVTLPHDKTKVYIADSTLGLVWLFDSVTGEYQVAIQAPEMAVPATASLAIGINGIRVHRGYLYFVNSFVATFYRIKIHHTGLVVAGAKVEKVATLDATFIDDFTFGPSSKSTIWAATNLDDRVIAVELDGDDDVVVEGAVGSFTVAGDTATHFGRGPTDQQVLYVVTGGATINGTTQGGKVVAVDTTGFKF